MFEKVGGGGTFEEVSWKIFGDKERRELAKFVFECGNSVL